MKTAIFAISTLKTQCNAVYACVKHSLQQSLNDVTWSVQQNTENIDSFKHEMTSLSHMYDKVLTDEITRTLFVLLLKTFRKFLDFVVR